MNEDQERCLKALEEANEGNWVITRWVAVKAYGLSWPNYSGFTKQSSEDKKIMLKCRKTLHQLALMGLVEEAGSSSRNSSMWRLVQPPKSE